MTESGFHDGELAVRVNGTLTHAGIDSLQITVDQAFGNCPKYIQQTRSRAYRAP